MIRLKNQRELTRIAYFGGENPVGSASAEAAVGSGLEVLASRW